MPLPRAALLAALLLVALVYLPAAGRGFIRDDFRWIRDGRAMLADPIRPFRPRAPDFYRPLVTASFALDYRVYGLNARGYGATNLMLFGVCAAALWLVCRALGLGAPAAAVAAFAWVANPHGINMALLWISGRTSLLLTCGALFSGYAVLRGFRWTAAALLFAALLAKEEATVLPFVLIAWAALFRRSRGVALALDIAALAAPLVAYFALRLPTPALTPATAPAFYRFTSAEDAVVNVLSYLDRAGTVFAVVALTAWIAYGFPRTAPAGRVAAGAAVWFAGAIALTMWVPVRSSLYAVFPSAGAAIMCAAAIDAFRASQRDPRQGDRRLGLVLLAALAATPIYRARNARWVEPARLSAAAVRALQTDPPEPGTGGAVVFEEAAADSGPTFADAFGSLAAVAAQQVTGAPLDARIVSSHSPYDGPVAARYVAAGGTVRREH